jgi:hypothetical protein
MNKPNFINLQNKDDLQWKTTSDGRRPPMEDDHRWKTTSNGRGLPMDVDLQWKKTLLEDNLQWKNTSKY